MSPALHWIHHSINPEHYDKNLGMKFPFWDKNVWNIFRRKSSKKILRYGVENTEYNRYNLFILLFTTMEKNISKN